MQQWWNMATDSGGGRLTVMSILTYGTIKKKNLRSSRRVQRQYRRWSDGSSGISNLYIFSRRMHFHAWLQPLIVHWFVGNMSQSQPGLPLFIFLSKTLDPLRLPSALLKCDGKQTCSRYLMVERKTILRDWRWFITRGSGGMGGGALRGLRWDRPLNQSLPPEDSARRCWGWLTEQQSRQCVPGTPRPPATSVWTPRMRS